jgi:hypothetical protein
MTGQGSERPNELIEHAPVTLRRFRADDGDAAPSAGSGTGVVWRLTRQALTR